MFLGEYEYKIDEKGRVPIPPKFRKELKEGLVLSPSPDKCIVGYAAADWRKVADRITSGSLTPDKIRRLRRVLFGGAFSLNLDGQGRVALPTALRSYAQLEDEVVIVGLEDYLEMWNRELWEPEKTADLEQYWRTVESLE